MKNQRNNEPQVSRLDLSEILSGEQAALVTHTRPTEAFAQTRSQRNIPRRPAGTQSVAKWLMAGSGDYKLRPRTSQPKRCAQHPTRSSGSAAAAKQICRRASCSSRSPESLLMATPRSWPHAAPIKSERFLEATLHINRLRPTLQLTHALTTWSTATGWLHDLMNIKSDHSWIKNQSQSEL